MLNLFNRGGKKEMNRKVKSEMALKGLTNKELAMKVGISETWCSLVVHGHKKSERVRKAIARALGVSVAELWPENNGKRAA